MRRIIQLCFAVGQVEVAFCEPMAGGEAYLYERKHHRHLDQHAYHRRQGGARREAEEHRGRGDGDLEVVGSAYHSGRRRIFVRQFEDPGKAVMASPKFIFTIIGYIMKKRHIAMGIDMTGASPT